MPTGVAGLDEILHGGLPKGALTVISGGPGAGKTLLGLETLYRAGRNGEPGVVVSFEERTDHLKRNVRVLGWDLAALEAAGSMALIEARIDPAAVIAGAFDLAGILAILEQRVHKLGASRILLDAPDVFLRLLDDPVRERRELQRIHDWLRQHALTALMTVKHRGCETLRYDFLDYMADCVITLDQRVDQQVATRRLRVIKYRGSDFGRNEYPFAIFRDGLHIIPVTATSLR
ncbi:MAG: ATPase domain-containing protein, partial [Planctomycetota bacterium]